MIQAGEYLKSSLSLLVAERVSTKIVSLNGETMLSYRLIFKEGLNQEFMVTGILKIKRNHFIVTSDSSALKNEKNKVVSNYRLKSG